jgi:hypothetical protein
MFPDLLEQSVGVGYNAYKMTLDQACQHMKDQRYLEHGNQSDRQFRIQRGRTFSVGTVK